MSDHILVEQDGPVATVVFNRPKMRNAISLAMWSEIARGDRRASPRTTRCAPSSTAARAPRRSPPAPTSPSSRRTARTPRPRSHYNQQTEAAYSPIRGVPEAHGGHGLRLSAWAARWRSRWRAISASPPRARSSASRPRGSASSTGSIRCISSWTWSGRPTPRTSSTRRAPSRRRRRSASASSSAWCPPPSSRPTPTTTCRRSRTTRRSRCAAPRPRSRPSSRASPTSIARTSARWASRRSTARTTRKARGPSSRSGAPRFQGR